MNFKSRAQVKRLIGLGASASYQNERGNSALLACAGDSGHLELAKLLIQNGADVNVSCSPSFPNTSGGAGGPQGPKRSHVYRITMHVVCSDHSKAGMDDPNDIDFGQWRPLHRAATNVRPRSAHSDW